MNLDTAGRKQRPLSGLALRSPRLPVTYWLTRSYSETTHSLRVHSGEVSEDVLTRKGRWDTPRFAQNNPLRPCFCSRLRTQVTLPDGASHTTYAYSGNTVTVTDPGGRWKKYTMDVFGNVTQVNEPNPAGRRGLRTPVRLQRLRQAHHRDHAAHRSKGGSDRSGISYTGGSHCSSPLGGEAFSTSYWIGSVCATFAIGASLRFA